MRLATHKEDGSGNFARRRRRLARTARLALPGALLCLALSGSPAAAATALPELIAPTASSTHNSPLSVEYKLPEAGANATISFVPTTGSPIVVTLTSAAAAAGTHHFFLDLHQLANETANVTEASASVVPDGEYTVQLGYQNAALDPIAFVEAKKVTIKTSTGAPVLSEPTAGRTFRGPFTVAYALPEAALPGSVRLTLFGTHAGVKTFVLSDASAGSHTVEIVPSNPTSGTGVASAPSERLPTDTYQISLSYQDTLDNPAASSTSVAVGVAYPLCKVGSYSAGGEEPCLKSPKGSAVPIEGATAADECIAGRFAPEEGLSTCVPASPGHYVPESGAKSELECEQGTFSDTPGRSSCSPAPYGHYAQKGSIMPAACPAGTFDAHTDSPSAEFCEYDSPGWYSGEGGAEPIPCVPGKYASSYGSEECLPAPTGSYVEVIGASVATPCPAGTFAPVTGSVSCTVTPEDTYATGGAGEATPCPAGTHAPAGSSSCTAASNAAAGGGSSQADTTTTPSPSKPLSASPSPSPVAIAPLLPAATKFAIAASRRGGSLARTRKQRYLLTCSTAMTVQVRVGAVVSVHKKHLALPAPTLTLRCKAAKPTEAAAGFRLSSAAKQLLRKRPASVKLIVRVYGTGSAKGTPLASATLRGRA